MPLNIKPINSIGSRLGMGTSKNTLPTTSISHPGGMGQRARTSVNDRSLNNAPTTSVSRKPVPVQSTVNSDEELRNRNYFEYIRRMAMKNKKKL